MLIQKDLIREILLIAFTAAIFKNLSDSFFSKAQPIVHFILLM